MLLADVRYCCFNQLEASRVVAMHRHNCFELIYFMAGYGQVHTAGDKSFVFSPDHYLLIRPFEPHDEKHNSATETLCVGFMVRDGDGRELICGGLFDDGNKRILPLIKKIQSDLRQEPVYHDRLIDLHMSEALLLHQRMRGVGERQVRGILQNALHYIEENYTQDIDLDMLARLSGYSYDHFRHRFAEETGDSPMHYIIKKRILLAQQLLSETADAITDIAYHCGFSSHSYFSSEFRKYTGMSPMAYRQRQGDIDTHVIGRNL